MANLGIGLVRSLRGAARAAPRGRIAALIIAGALCLGSKAEARALDDCQLAWSKAVRSYLTKNRKAAPDGATPKDMDSMEVAAQQWLSAFRPACEIEAAGDKPTARIEAAALGVQILARLDSRGCSRFLEFFMESTRPEATCRSAATMSGEELRDEISRTIPAK